MQEVVRTNESPRFIGARIMWIARRAVLRSDQGLCYVKLYPRHRTYDIWDAT
jgi:hypothetical protein